MSAPSPPALPSPAPFGSGDDFILAWGRSNALASILRWLCLLEGVVILGLSVLCGWLAYRNEHRETYVFVKDQLGNVIQADARGFLHAGDTRTEVDIKAFVRNWALDAYTWTPLDVQDRLASTLRLVDPRARAAVRDALRLDQRAQQVHQGLSCRVHDDPSNPHQQPSVLILRAAHPIEVLATLDRYAEGSNGHREELGKVHLNLVLKEVPRSPDNPTGLLIVDARASERL